MGDERLVGWTVTEHPTGRLRWLRTGPETDGTEVCLQQEWRTTMTSSDGKGDQQLQWRDVPTEVGVVTARKLPPPEEFGYTAQEVAAIRDKPVADVLDGAIFTTLVGIVGHDNAVEITSKAAWDQGLANTIEVLIITGKLQREGDREG